MQSSYIPSATSVVEADTERIALMIQGDKHTFLRTDRSFPAAQARARQLLVAEWRRANPMQSLTLWVQLARLPILTEFGELVYEESLARARLLDKQYYDRLSWLA